MQGEVGEREQVIAGLLFFAVFTVVGAVVSILVNESFGLVVGSMVALVAAVLYIAYRLYPKRKQHIKEQIEELRYQARRAKADAEAFAAESGINDGVAWIDAQLEWLGREFRERFDRTAIGRKVEEHLGPGSGAAAGDAGGAGAGHGDHELEGGSVEETAGTADDGETASGTVSGDAGESVGGDSEGHGDGHGVGGVESGNDAQGGEVDDEPAEAAENDDADDGEVDDEPAGAEGEDDAAETEPDADDGDGAREATGRVEEEAEPGDVAGGHDDGATPAGTGRGTAPTDDRSPLSEDDP